MSRSAFHQQHAERATAEAQRLIDQRSALGARWLSWVASELYQLTPPEYAAMVRRELARLNAG
ncbi:hypothetical protein EA797_10900 [Stutzerimonas zhaodongensis]|uniref:Uncharacterized protein n=1 Tax=Stutzerimonas zhaodongensis TaxID=1176257 RepID=A0A3M2HJW3_9GAMM|nr:hypothetical protein [Stutzerimonas zhaodongensis]MCQ2028599.1 hypothetical protein [Stutzerimonas zhaodongensis]MCQ4315423.1 hypothetical protein [Stutzerimonas zhaodongensis]RMH90026.1 hypothetical protein EA797_10900 [Stutzerimonas zhaodongensis]